MTKYLTAREKAQELGITTSGLAKTRHLYKHIKKSPHKYLYFAEEDRDIIRPNTLPGPLNPGTPGPPGHTEGVMLPSGQKAITKLRVETESTLRF